MWVPVPLHSNVLQSKLRFTRTEPPKSHSYLLCAKLHTFFKICLIRRIFTWYYFFELSGTHLWRKPETNADIMRAVSSCAFSTTSGSPKSGRFNFILGIATKGMHVAWWCGCHFMIKGTWVWHLALCGDALLGLLKAIYSVPFVDSGAWVCVMTWWGFSDPRHSWQREKLCNTRKGWKWFMRCSFQYGTHCHFPAWKRRISKMVSYATKLCSVIPNLGGNIKDQSSIQNREPDASVSGFVSSAAAADLCSSTKCRPWKGIWCQLMNDAVDHEGVICPFYGFFFQQRHEK